METPGYFRDVAVGTSRGDVGQISAIRPDKPAASSKGSGRWELAELDAQKPEISALLQQEIELVSQQLAEMNKRVEVGAGSKQDGVTRQREMLKLQRELLRVR